MANRLPLKDRLRDHPLMAEPEEITCRLCGYVFVPEFKGQLYCDEDCEFRDRKIDEAEVRAEERRDA
jgi:hypothetical protein